MLSLTIDLFTSLKAPPLIWEHEIYFIISLKIDSKNHERKHLQFEMFTKIQRYWLCQTK